MQTQRTELLSQLPEHGWRIARIEENLEWWADEMWLLESEWSPVGSRAYITFLVDPMSDRNRKKGEEVWAVMGSLFRPVSSLKSEQEFLLSLGSGWKDELPFFCRRLECFRGANLDQH
jgi:hypothetical protein